MPEIFGLVPWKHHVLILSKYQTLDEAIFYINKVTEEGWSRSRLERQMVERTVWELNKGPKSSTWEQTKQMAFDLNENGFDVAFLPELLNGVCADSLIRNGRVFKIADFKYCVTSKANTLSIDLEHGFEQANNVVLKLVNMDGGSFKEAVDYLLRNGIPYGNIILINKYGEVLELSKKEFKTGIYKKRIKGFL